MVMEALASLPDQGDTVNPVGDAGNELSLDDFVKPPDWPDGKNWGTLTIDASCIPADIQG
jgi:IS5 family transposase